MTKKILAIAIAICGICVFSAMAQTTQCGTQTCQAGDNNKMYQPRTFTDFAFEGILLEPAQQARIDSLNAAFQTNCPKGQKPECDKANCDKKDKKCKKAECDSTNCDKKGDCDKQGPKGKRRMNPGAKTEYIKAVKEVLTPEQYTTFLENIVFMPEQQGPRMGRENGPRLEKGNCQQGNLKGKKAAKGTKEKKSK